MLRSKKIKFGLFIILLVFLCIGISFAKDDKPNPAQGPHLLKSFSFTTQEDLEQWEEKIFKGRVNYEVEKTSKDTFISPDSDNTASALYYKIKIDMKKHPILSWRWNVTEFPTKIEGDDLKNTRVDDYGGRMYIIFPGFLPTGAKALEYIWTETIPKGTISPSPYSPNLQLIVIERGREKIGKWVSEKRDLYEDYVAAFGVEPKIKAGAIVFMTDSDSTGTKAQALYDDIKIEYKEGE